MSGWMEVEVLGTYFEDRVNQTADILDVVDEGKRKNTKIFGRDVIKIEKMGKNNFRGQYYVLFLRYQEGR